MIRWWASLCREAERRPFIESSEYFSIQPLAERTKGDRLETHAVTSGLDVTFPVAIAIVRRRVFYIRLTAVRIYTLPFRRGDNP